MIIPQTMTGSRFFTEKDLRFSSDQREFQMGGSSKSLQLQTSVAQSIPHSSEMHQEAQHKNAIAVS